MVLDAVDANAIGSVVEKAGPGRNSGGQLRPAVLGSPIAAYVSFENERRRRTAGRSADGKTQRRRQPDGSDRDDQRRPDRSQRRSVQGRGEEGVRNRRRENRQGIRHARMEPRQSPERDGAGDHGARQQRFRRRLRRQRRHRGRCDRGDEGRRDQTGNEADHRSGRRTRSDPADPRRRTVHDRSTSRPKPEAESRAPKSPSRWPRAKKCRPA